MGYPFLSSMQFNQKVSSLLQSGPMSKTESKSGAEAMTRFVRLVIRATRGPSARSIEAREPVILERDLEHARPCAQTVEMRIFSFSVFFSGTKNIILRVSIRKPSQIPTCVGSSSLFSMLTRKPVASRHSKITEVLVWQLSELGAMLKPSSR